MNLPKILSKLVVVIKEKVIRLRSITLPSRVTIGLSVGAGVLAYLNQTTFSIAQPWHTLVTGGLGIFSVLGITPMAHGALRNVLHLTYPVSLTLAAGLASCSIGLATVTMNLTLRSLLVGLLASVGGMLAGPAVPVVPVLPAPGGTA